MSQTSSGEPDPIKRLIFVFFVATLIVIGEFGLYSIRWIVMTSAIGICMGIIIAPIIDFFEIRFRFPRLIGALTFVVLCTAFLGVMVILFFRLGTDQFELIVQNYPEIMKRINLRLVELFAQYPWLERQIDLFDIQQTSRSFLQSTFLGIRIGGEAIAGFVIIFFIAIYTAVSPRYYLTIILSLMPEPRRQKVEKVLILIAQNLRRWFSSQLIAMIIVGVGATIGLWVIGIDYWLLFGVLTGVMDIVPYIGAFIPAAGAVAVSLFDSSEKVPWIIVLFIFVHQLENNVIVPLTMKYRMKFPPVFLMIAVMIMASFFGIVGILFTPALFTIGQTIFTELVRKRK